MRSNLITVVTAVASSLLVASVASADQVQEQLRLMEQRMAEMEDRLQATSDELQNARQTVDSQQALLSDAGLVEEDEGGLRSAVGNFFEEVDVSGVAAASFNYRLIESENRRNLTGTATPGAGNVGYFKNPNSNTFQLDQLWLTLDKAPNDESRGGFHAEIIAGESAQAQVGTGNAAPSDDELALYSAYVSYLAPIGNGVQVDLGKLPTPLGAEVVQTNGNFFITQGAVFGLQPVVHTGVSLTTAVTDEVTFTAGVVNDVYSDSATSFNNDKAYYGQVQFGGENFGLNVGGIWGSNRGAAVAAGQADVNTSVLDVVLTADPTENLSVWANFDWVHTSGTGTGAAGGGTDVNLHGDAFGIAGAGRLALTDTMGVATRVEYVTTEDSLAGLTRDTELLTLTGTLDKTLAEGLVSRIELRWDTRLDDNNNGAGFQIRNDGGATNNDQLVALWQMFYEF